MFARFLVADGHAACTRCDIGSIAEVESRVRDLNGRDRSLVSISRDSDLESNLMTIGGDARSGLVVYATFSDGLFHQLLNPNAVGPTREVVAGGQPGDYPTEYVVAVETALMAVRSFVEHGELVADGCWLTE